MHVLGARTANPWARRPRVVMAQDGGQQHQATVGVKRLAALDTSGLEGDAMSSEPSPGLLLTSPTKASHGWGGAHRAC